MIHQPHFLPWPGYIARCIAADKVVLLNDVKFNHNHFQHRTMYIDQTGQEKWLTLPIARRTRSKSISEVEIADSFSFMRWQRPFREAYRKYPHFHGIWPDISALITQKAPGLAAVSGATVGYLLEKVSSTGHGSGPVIVGASCTELRCDRTQRLVKVCADEQITHLIMGEDALACHDRDVLRESRVTLVRHVYRGPAARAPQPGITVLDDIFRLGWTEVARRLVEDWTVVSIGDASSR
jgi:hypothetical protein